MLDVKDLRLGIPWGDLRQRPRSDTCEQVATLFSLNVGLPRPIETPSGTVMTGIFKVPTDKRLRVLQQHIDGDGQADLSAHGGDHKAVYGYPHEHYATWSDELGREDLTPGQFGENLTTEGLLETDVGIGDVFRVGSATLQVSQPRSPCFKLGIRMGDPKFVRTFLRSGRPGFYFRVVEKGSVAAGDTLERIEEGPTGITVYELWDLSFGRADDAERRALAATIPTLGPEWTTALERRG
jgi:MOSC domain-containing protein YiiM